MNYKLIAIFILALFLRLLTVFLTTDVLMEKNLFPSYYFSDSYMYHKGAVTLGEKKDFFYTLPDKEYSPDHANYIRLTTFFYSIFGSDYKVMMFVNAFISSFIVFFIYLLGKSVYDELVGLFASLTYAVFPSLIFWGAQHLRDSFIAFFNLLALLSALFLLDSKGYKIINYAVVFAISLLLSGLLRPHFVVFMIIASILSTAIYIIYRQFNFALKSLACALITFIDKFIISKVMITSVPMLTSIPTLKTSIPTLKTSLSLNNLINYVATYRLRFMQLMLGNDIPAQTLLYPYWKPSSVIDFLVMEAKLVFYVLFMPLPWLYSTGGRIARLFSSIENLIFLILFLVGVYGFLQSLKKANKLMFVFIGIYLLSFISIYAFIAPDLGSAMRYKLQYVPIMLPIIAYGGMEVWKKLKWFT